MKPGSTILNQIQVAIEIMVLYDILKEEEKHEVQNQLEKSWHEKYLK
jgi:hypothetical protein